MTLSVSEIHTYPVKSLRGISLASSVIRFAGLAFDRQWMVISPDHQMLTQRTHPQMALVETALDGDSLVLDAFGMPPHWVPAAEATMPKITSDVWGSEVVGVDLGEETATWMSQAIGTPCRLIKFPSTHTRSCDPSVSNPDDHTHYADGFPLLIITQPSLDDLNSRLAKPVSMQRFRPNIVMTGCTAYDEDRWREIAVGDIPVRMVTPCARCSVPTVDPGTGTLAGPEPIHTLSSYREWEGEVCFGMNAIPDAEGVIEVGTSCRVLS